LVPESLLDGSDLLVIIGGFVHFHDGTDRDTRISKLAVRRMIQKLDREPKQVVADFYENCGLPENYAAAQVARLKNLALLKSDLELLDQSAFGQKQLLKPKEILILHGEQDSIAPVHHAATLKKLRPDAVVAIHSEASHALPYDYPEWCLQQIESSLMVPGR
jgi:pimeloyl-ACP methyl ester carboxylesterase